MHIVFDLQAAAAPISTDAADLGRHAISLAQAAARHANARSSDRHPPSRVTLVLSAAEPELVVRIRRQFTEWLGDRVSLHVWHPVPGTTSWHREAHAVVYRQLLGRLGADALVFSDMSGAGGHALAGAPDWLPAGCRGLFLAERDATAGGLPGDPMAWERVLRSNHAAIHVPGHPGPRSSDILQRPVSPALSEDEAASLAFRAITEALERLRQDAGAPSEAPPRETAQRRLRLAYVSPLPPARTGIADYSADLVGALAAHYDIDLIVDSSEGEAEAASVPPHRGGTVRSVEWFERHGGDFDRVLYHFGNSPFHHHMPALCERFPGTIVLHDFFLGDLLWTRDFAAHRARWQQAYYRSHGYGALREAMQDENLRAVLARYPVNFEFLRHSRGVVVHSERACELAAQWLPPALAERFRRIPLLRIPAPAEDRASRRSAARRALGLAPERFVICCFGMVGRAKANLEILEAWLRMDGSSDTTELVFVGANEDGEYGRRLTDAIAAAGDAASRVRITGWVDGDGYRRYLEAADIAVQLRTVDRGETSAAVLDCMNHGLPTIVNDRGSMAELPADAVCKVPAECTVDDIAGALSRLHHDVPGRASMADAAMRLLHGRHAPAACAAAYRDVLEEDFHRHAAGTWEAAVPELARLPGTIGQDRETLAVLSNAVAATLPVPCSAKRLLVDVTAICRNDLRTGIQRVVRALLVELIESPPHGYRIEPVYLCDRAGAWHLRFARQYTLGLLGMRPQDGAFEDEIVEAQAGDRFLGLDFSSGYIVEAARLHLFDALRRNGVAMDFVVYDLLPVLRPEVFPQEAGAMHERWLRVVLDLSDNVACISHAVAGELRQWARSHAPDSEARIAAFHLGADVAASAPTRGLPDDAQEVLAALRDRPTFLAVGTVEPRKGIAQALAAFECLWRQGTEVNLVLVGKPGWHVEVLVEALKSHPELGRRLFWLAGISDEYLEAVYSQSTCLLAASEAEGFGLPLIEAAQKGLPILARDIPVFREVAGEHAFYFSGFAQHDLVEAVERWLKLHVLGGHPSSSGMPWLTWRESASQLCRVMRI